MADDTPTAPTKETCTPERKIASRQFWITDPKSLEFLAAWKKLDLGPANKLVREALRIHIKKLMLERPELADVLHSSRQSKLPPGSRSRCERCGDLSAMAASRRSALAAKLSASTERRS
jgi:hypothetical protein